MSERRQQILEAALQILVTKGYGALSMRAVAAASGLTLGALQYHFRTRADLLGALADFVAEAYHADFARFLADGPPPASRLHARFPTGSRASRQRPRSMPVVLRERAPSPRPDR